MTVERARGANRATISDVAAEAGVGRASAARTLGNYGAVSPALRQRVLEAAEKLGYRTNTLARSVSTGVSHTLGVVVADIGNPFFAGVVRGISDASRAAGFDTIVLSTLESVAEEQAAVGVLLDKRVDGIILSTAVVGRDSISHLQAAEQQGIPIVLVDRTVSGLDLDTVVVDNRESSRRAVEQLIQAGHSRIGFVWGPTMPTPPSTRRELLAAVSAALWTDGERLRGYLDALDDARIAFDSTLVMTGEKSEQGAKENVERMLSAPDRPTALFCTETDSITGTLRAMRKLALSYPDDVSLIGFDDSSWAAVMSPPLSMIEQPMLKMGMLATERLLARINGEQITPAIHTLESRMMPRASVTPPTVRPVND